MLHSLTDLAILHHTRLALTSLALSVSLGIAPADAGRVNPAHLPADAKWVIHVDYEALGDSAVWQKFREKKSQVTQMVQSWMKQRYGIDLPTGLKSLTMFSRDYREYTGTVLIEASYEAQKIEARLGEARQHRTTKWQDYTLHTIMLSKQKSPNAGPSGDQEMTVVMVDDKTILLASSEANAKQSLKLLAGEAESLEGKDSPLLADTISEAWVYGAAIDLNELKQHPVSMPIIVQHEQITWSLGKQSDGMVFEQADLVAQSAEVAEKMKTVLEGIIAYESLWAEGSQSLTAIIEKVQVEHAGKTTSFQWRGSSEQVVAATEDIFERLESWKPILMKHSPKHGKKD